MEDRFLEKLINNLSNLEAEKIVLGSIVISKNIYYTFSSSLFIDLFSMEAHKYIFKSIQDIAASGRDIDIVTINEQCLSNGYNQLIKKNDPTYNGPAYISSLTSNIGNTTHFESHLDILSKYWQIRKIQSISLELQQKCTRLEDPTEMIDFINEEIVDIININEEEFDKESTVKDTLHNMEQSSLDKIIKTGIEELDKFIFGFELGEKIVLAGAASMGKTAFALRLFKNFAVAGLYPAFFSLEMSDVQLTTRLIAMDSNIPLSDIRRRNLTSLQWKEINSAASRLLDLNFIIDTKSNKLNQIANKIRKYYIKYGTKIFIIDYLQLIENKINGKNNREQEIAIISRTLKKLCLELKIVIIDLSQLNREVGKRTNKRPQLSDLRESGSIEQDADMVLFPYRPAYYDTFETKIPYKENAVLIIGKGRGTGLGDVPLTFISTRTLYLNTSKEQEFEFNEPQNITDEF